MAPTVVIEWTQMVAEWRDDLEKTDQMTHTQKTKHIQIQILDYIK